MINIFTAKDFDKLAIAYTKEDDDKTPEDFWNEYTETLKKADDITVADARASMWLLYGLRDINPELIKWAQKYTKN